MRPFFRFHGFFFTTALLLCFSCQNIEQPSHASIASKTAREGASIFEKNCKLCHGIDGRLGLNGAKDLTISQVSLMERVKIITHGKNLMTPFGTLLSPEEIDSVAEYTLHLSQAKPK